MPRSITELLELPTFPATAVDMSVLLGTAFFCGCTIALVFRLIRPRDQYQPTFPSTLVLLTVLCAMLPMVIGQNVAWAFGLVGALSIVRFRTVIEDTHDIAFVIFSVLVGMAVGADRLPVAFVGLAVTAIAAIVVRPRSTRDGWLIGGSRLSIRMATDQDPELVLSGEFDRLLITSELISGGTNKQGTVLELTYRVKLRSGTQPTDVLRQLNAIDGVRSVELRQGR